MMKKEYPKKVSLVGTAYQVGESARLWWRRSGWEAGARRLLSRTFSRFMARRQHGLDSSVVLGNKGWFSF